MFDGHGGRDASIFAAQNMQRVFLRHLDEAGGDGGAAADIRACLHATFMELSRQMAHFVCGTTAVVLVLANGKIYTANVGDSRAVSLLQLPPLLLHTYLFYRFFVVTRERFLSQWIIRHAFLRKCSDFER